MRDLLRWLLHWPSSGEPVVVVIPVIAATVYGPNPNAIVFGPNPNARQGGT